MLSEETKFLWNSIKHHLCDNGLFEMERLYPELKDDISHIRQYRPDAIQFANQFEDKMVGSVVGYHGTEWKKYTEGKKVTVAKTPLSSAVDGYVCFQTADGFILTAPRIDLRFEP